MSKKKKKKKHNAGDGLPHAWIGALISGIQKGAKIGSSTAESFADKDEYGYYGEDDKHALAASGALNPLGNIGAGFKSEDWSKQEKWNNALISLTGFGGRYRAKMEEKYGKKTKEEARVAENERVAREKGNEAMLANSLRYDRNIPTFAFGGGTGNPPNRRPSFAKEVTEPSYDDIYPAGIISTQADVDAEKYALQKYLERPPHAIKMEKIKSLQENYIDAVRGLPENMMSAEEFNRTEREDKLIQDYIKQTDNPSSNPFVNIPNKALGGSMNVDEIEGYSHEEGGTNIANKVEAEKKETKVEDYIFSDRLKIKAKDIKEYDLPASYKNKSFAQITKRIEGKLSKREGDPLDLEEKERQLTELMNIQEVKRKDLFTNQATELAETYPDFIKALGGSLSEPPTTDKKPIEFPYAHIKKTKQEPYIRKPINDALIREYQQEYERKSGFYPDHDYTKKILQLDQDLEMSEYYLNRLQEENEEESNKALGGFIADPPIPKKGRQYLTKEEKVKYEKEEMLKAILRSRKRKAIKNPGFGTFDLSKGKKKAWAGGPFEDYEEVSQFGETESLNNEGMDWAYESPYQFGMEEDNEYLDDTSGDFQSNIYEETEEEVLRRQESEIENARQELEKDTLKQGRGDTFKNIGREVGLQAGNIYDIVRGTTELLKEDKELGRVRPQTVSASYLDPNQSLLDIKTAFNVAEDNISQQTSDVGSILAARLGLASSEAKNVAGVRSQYEQQNVQISNRAKMFNAQMQSQTGKVNLDQSNYEEMINQQRRDVASNMIQSGLSNAAEIYASRVRDKEMAKVQDQVIRMIGSDDFTYDIALDKVVARDYNNTGETREFSIQELMAVTGRTREEVIEAVR